MAEGKRLENSAKDLTLATWLRGVVDNARGQFDGVSFWELAEIRATDLRLSPLTVAIGLLDQVESLLPGLGVDTSEWLPFVKIPAARTASLAIVSAGEVSFPDDLEDASLCIDKCAQLFFWGSWESYQSTTLLSKQGFPGHRLMWLSSINDRDHENSWDTYENGFYIFRTSRMYA